MIMSRKEGVYFRKLQYKAVAELLYACTGRVHVTTTWLKIADSPFVHYQSKIKDQKRKTHNSWDSLVVTHPTTNQPI